ncbi:DUF4197 domain-containing protein [Desulfobacter hydrogenophilus]|uniref:DUF4197 domain-containing protein n=1 Tax=Desulfobacter hydrogenophilus TaxID=2291 RepID=A0A328FIF5_9BACT|nr:DUF4197 domain-containing protein [Desulfobacter hydrogenophilus]NDY73402.1 DUF4197 domain-containing protein [Desulfobacter hydrogenophilus]QBH12943.1 DUF4197 domain-containing protein [Desulfobacter hydrogenophilus]RAM03926.1 DUF4197 domain-containing protein [Desulfobacter hydrogenophilus]
MCKKRISVSAIALVFAFVLGGQGSALAGNSLLDQGSSLIKSMGKGDTSESSSSGSSSSLSNSEIISGLKQALETGAGTVVSQLGAENGFNSDASIHIPLPSYLSTVQTLMDKAGLGSYAEDLELKLNRAAEAATPKAKALFVNAISQMSFDDANSILNGADDAATQYFKKKTSDDLTEAFTPVVEETLEDVGAIKSYEQMMEKYKSLPLVPDVRGNLADYTVDEALDGIFYYLAKEEKAIRENPAKQTTALLKKLFN